MKRRVIFLIGLVSVGIFSCNEELTEPRFETLEGDWHVTWESTEGSLTGEMRADLNKAQINAFGSGDSPLLSHFDKAVFTYFVKDDRLTLINQNSQLRMEYVILNRDHREWDLEYLGEIKVRFLRK